jgi:hypothetical protein
MTQGLKPNVAVLLVDPTTGAPVGILGADGKEYLLGAVANAAGATQPAAYVPSAVAITGGNIDGAVIGNTTPAIVKATRYYCSSTDISGTPGNGTVSTGRGRAAFAAAASTVTITSTICSAGSTVLVQLGGADATLTSVRVTPGAGSFTVTGNAAATGITPFDFVVVN